MYYKHKSIVPVKEINVYFSDYEVQKDGTLCPCLYKLLMKMGYQNT